jgi:hypothetical protein
MAYASGTGETFAKYYAVLYADNTPRWGSRSGAGRAAKEGPDRHTRKEVKGVDITPHRLRPGPLRGHVTDKYIVSDPPISAIHNILWHAHYPNR